MSLSTAGIRSANADPRVERIIILFEHLSPADLERLDQFYSADARFKDPFNDIQGVPAIAAVFRHMFDSLDRPRFTVKDVIVQADQCFLIWDFSFGMRRFDRREQTIRGASHLLFDGAGLISVHRDYWDAAEELYEKLPVLGSLMRWLKRRAST